MKGDFWKQTHIGIPEPDTESNDAVVLGFLVAQFIGEVHCLCLNNIITVLTMDSIWDVMKKRCSNFITFVANKFNRKLFKKTFVKVIRLPPWIPISCPTQLASGLDSYILSFLFPAPSPLDSCPHR